MADIANPTDPTDTPEDAGTPTPTDTTNAEATPTGVDGGEQKPRQATDYERELREEARQHRLETKAVREQLDAFQAGIAQALGLEGTGPEKVEATVADVARERDTYATETAALKRELAALRAAAAAGIDGDALLDSRRFIDRLADLDSTADDYEQQISDLVKASAPRPAATTATATSIPTGGQQTQARDESTDVASLRTRFFSK